MTALTFFQPFLEAVMEKKHNMGADSLKVFLCNAANAPLVADAVLADQVEVAYTFCSTRALVVATSAQAAGVYSLVINDLTLTATGGAVGPFRYIGIYNDTAASDELVCFYDLGSEVTIPDGQSFLCDFNNVDGLFQLTIAP